MGVRGGHPSGDLGNFLPPWASVSLSAKWGQQGTHLNQARIWGVRTCKDQTGCHARPRREGRGSAPRGSPGLAARSRGARVSPEDLILGGAPVFLPKPLGEINACLLARSFHTKEDSNVLKTQFPSKLSFFTKILLFSGQISPPNGSLPSSSLLIAQRPQPACRVPTWAQGV